MARLFGKEYHEHSNTWFFKSVITKLEEDDITQREGLRITSVERTVANVIVWGISYQHAHQAVHEALQRGLTTRRKLSDYADRRKGRTHRLYTIRRDGSDQIVDALA